jgi:hypothetical protein
MKELVSYIFDSITEDPRLHDIRELQLQVAKWVIKESLTTNPEWKTQYHEKKLAEERFLSE